MYLQLKFELILTCNKAVIDKEISIFNNGHHLERRVGLSETILKGDHPRNITVKFGSVVSEEKT